jgi:predicted DNA-binding protein
MSNSALVSFKVAPERYAVLKAMAESREQTLSEFIRETLEQALDLDRQARLLATFFAETAERDLQPA